MSFQATLDWPSAEFEALWTEVAGATPAGSFTKDNIAEFPVIARPNWQSVPAGAWVHIRGKLEQRTPLGDVHPNGEEWFVRAENGDPVAVYLMSDLSFSVGTTVSVLGRHAGLIRLMNRAGDVQEYQAVIARPLDQSATHTLQAAGQAAGHHGGAEAAGEVPLSFVVVGAVILLLCAWFAIRFLVKRSTGRPMLHIHQVADRARAIGMAEEAKP
ncbi:MAG: hypothetical protein EXS15_01620 [Phycisphaerales bacterium]|nr:hypothetical protein [Phycisphaerales bacterium]